MNWKRHVLDCVITETQLILMYHVQYFETKTDTCRFFHVWGIGSANYAICNIFANKL